VISSVVAAYSADQAVHWSILSAREALVFSKLTLLVSKLDLASFKMASVAAIKLVNLFFFSVKAFF